MKVFARLHPAAALHEQVEQLELRGGELERNAVDGNFVAVDIENDLADLQAALGRRRTFGDAEEGMDCARRTEFLR